MTRHQRLAFGRAAHPDDVADLFVRQRAHVGAVGVIARRRLQHAGARTIALAAFAVACHAVGLVKLLAASRFA
jgi:hypothetical protein